MQPKNLLIMRSSLQVDNHNAFKIGKNAKIAYAQQASSSCFPSYRRKIVTASKSIVDDSKQSACLLVCWKLTASSKMEQNNKSITKDWNPIDDWIGTDLMRSKPKCRSQIPRLRVVDCIHSASMADKCAFLTFWKIMAF